MPLLGLTASETPERWRPDLRAIELCGHFDSDPRFQAPYHKFLGYQERFDQLTRKEWVYIEAELRDCRRSFEYAAKNYFWIVEKGVSGQARDVRFALWKSQELILETIYWLKSKGRAQKLILIKARQLGMSTLIEAIIAWRTMFFPNIKALVASYNDGHSEYLFSMMLHIYDMMPWWLKPMISTRTYNDGLAFENPDPEQRRNNPGLKSSVQVQSASQNIGVATGVTLQACHLSEWARWDEDRARSIIKGDLEWALADNPTTIGVLESTPESSGTYAEDLWEASVEAGDDAKWYAKYLPWFFEPTRFLPPENGWKPHPPEAKMRDRVLNDWVRCLNAKCGRFRERHWQKQDLVGTICPQCGAGTLESYLLSDGQMRYMQRERVSAEKEGPETVKELRKNLSSTASQAFQLSGIQVFHDDVLDFVEMQVRPPITVGFFDSRGTFHGLKEQNRQGIWSCWAEGCQDDHSGDCELPMRVWEFPDKQYDFRYAVGVDVSEGYGGKHDYSVVSVNRLGVLSEPDVQVAVYRTNTMDPGLFAAIVNFVGRWYNDAMVAIEYNSPCGAIVANEVQHHHLYPNLFRWKHYDAVGNVMSNRYHWFTNENTRPSLWQKAIKRLRQGLWLVRSANTLHEMKHFKKDREDTQRADAEHGHHDDELFAAMIGTFTSHDLDFDPLAAEGAASASPEDGTGIRPAKDWQMKCQKCAMEWEAERPDIGKCPRCESPWVTGKPKTPRDIPTAAKTLWDELMSPAPVDIRVNMEYDAL